MMGFWKRLGWNIALTVNQMVDAIGRNNVAGSTKERIAKEDDSIAERIFSSPERLRRNFTVDNVIEVISHYAAKEQRHSALLEARNLASDQGGEAAVARLPQPEQPSSFWKSLSVNQTLAWQDSDIADDDRIFRLSQIFKDAHILSEQDRAELTKRIPNGPNRVPLQNQHNQFALIQLLELAYTFPAKFPPAQLEQFLNGVIEKAKNVGGFPGLAERILRSKILPLHLQQQFCDYFLFTDGVHIPESLKPCLIPSTFNSPARYRAAEEKNVYRVGGNISQESKEYVTKSLNNKNPRKPEVLQSLVNFALTNYPDLSPVSKNIFYNNALTNNYTAEQTVTTNKFSPTQKITLYLLSVTPEFLDAHRNELRTMLSDESNREARETFLTLLNDFCSDTTSHKNDNDVKRMKIALSILREIPNLNNVVNTRVGIIGFRRYKYAGLQNVSLYNADLIKFYLLNASPQFLREDLATVKALLQPGVDNTAARQTFLTILNDLCSNKTFDKDDNDIQRMEIALSLFGQRAGGDLAIGLSREASETRSGIFGLGGYKYEALRNEQLRNEELIRFYLFNASPEFFDANKDKVTAILANTNNTAARRTFLAILNEFYTDKTSNKEDNEIKRMRIALSILDEIQELKTVATNTRGGFLGLGYQFAALRDEPLRNESLIKFFMLNASPQFFRENLVAVKNILSNDNNMAARQAFLSIMDDFFSDANPDKPLTQSLRMQVAFAILTSVPRLQNEARDTTGFLGIGYKYAGLREKLLRLPFDLEEVPAPPRQPAAASDAQPASAAPHPVAPAATNSAHSSAPAAAAHAPSPAAGQPSGAAAAAHANVVLPDPAEAERVKREKLIQEEIATRERAEQEERADRERAEQAAKAAREEAARVSVAAALPSSQAASSIAAPVITPTISEPPSPPQQQLSRRGSDSSLNSTDGSKLSSQGSSVGDPLTPRSETDILDILTPEYLKAQEKEVVTNSTRQTKLANNKIYQEILSKINQSKLSGFALQTILRTYLAERNQFKRIDGKYNVPHSDTTLHELVDIAVNAGDYIAAETASLLFTCKFETGQLVHNDYLIKEFSKRDFQEIYSRHKANKAIIQALLDYLAVVKEPKNTTFPGYSEVAIANFKHAFDFALTPEGSEFANDFFKKFSKEECFKYAPRMHNKEDFEHFKHDKELLSALFSYLSECVNPATTISADENIKAMETIRAAYAYAQIAAGSAILPNGSSFAIEFYKLFPRGRHFKLFPRIYDKAEFKSFMTDKDYLTALFNYLSEYANPDTKISADDRSIAMTTIQNAYAYAQSYEGYAPSADRSSFAKAFYVEFPRKVTKIRQESFDELFEKVNVVELSEAEQQKLTHKEQEEHKAKQLKLINDREEFFNNLSRGAEVLFARKNSTAINHVVGSQEKAQPTEKVTNEDVSVAQDNHSVILKTLYSTHYQKFAKYSFESYDRAKIVAAEDTIVGVAGAICEFNPLFAENHITTLISAARNSAEEAKMFLDIAKTPGARGKKFAEKLFSRYEDAKIYESSGIISTAVALNAAHPSDPSFIENHIAVLEQAALKNPAEAEKFVALACTGTARALKFAARLFTDYAHAQMCTVGKIITTAIAIDKAHPSDPSFIERHIDILELAALENPTEAKEFVALTCTRDVRAKQFAARLFSDYAHAQMCPHDGIIKTALAIDAANPSDPSIVENRIDILEEAALKNPAEAEKFVGLACARDVRGKKFADRLFSSYANAKVCAPKGIIVTAIIIDKAYPSSPSFIERHIDILELAAQNSAAATKESNAKDAEAFVDLAFSAGERGKKFADRLFSSYANAKMCASKGIIDTALKLNKNDPTFVKRHIHILVEAAKNNEVEARQLLKNDTLVQILKHSISTEVVEVKTFQQSLFFIPVTAGENPLMMKFSFREKRAKESEQSYQAEKLQSAKELISALNYQCTPEQCTPEQLESSFIMLPNVDAKKALEESLHANGVREGYTLKADNHEESTDQYDTPGRYYDIDSLSAEKNLPARVLFPKPHNGSKELFEQYAFNKTLISSVSSKNWSLITFAKKLIQDTESLCKQLKTYLTPAAEQERKEQKRKKEEERRQEQEREAQQRKERELQKQKQAEQERIERENQKQKIREQQERERQAAADRSSGTSAAGHHATLFTGAHRRKIEQNPADVPAAAASPAPASEIVPPTTAATPTLDRTESNASPSKLRPGGIQQDE